MHEHADDEDNEDIKHNIDEVPDNIIAISVTGAPDTHLLQLIIPISISLSSLPQLLLILSSSKSGSVLFRLAPCHC